VFQLFTKILYWEATSPAWSNCTKESWLNKTESDNNNNTRCLYNVNSVTFRTVTIYICLQFLFKYIQCHKSFSSLLGFQIELYNGHVMFVVAFWCCWHCSCCYCFLSINCLCISWSVFHCIRRVSLVLTTRRVIQCRQPRILLDSASAYRKVPVHCLTLQLDCHYSPVRFVPLSLSVFPFSTRSLLVSSASILVLHLCFKRIFQYYII